MSFLYVTENQAVISLKSNYVDVKLKENQSKKIPHSPLESISILGRASMVTPCMTEEELLK